MDFFLEFVTRVINKSKIQGYIREALSDPQLTPTEASCFPTGSELILDSVALWLKEGVCQLITSSR